METENINVTQKTPSWYVIHVYSSYEFMVKNNLEKMIENNQLQDFIYEISIPVKEEIVERNGKRKVVERKKSVDGGKCCWWNSCRGIWWIC